VSARRHASQQLLPGQPLDSRFAQQLAQLDNVLADGLPQAFARVAQGAKLGGSGVARRNELGLLTSELPH
jgi:hypothetical protein